MSAVFMRRGMGVTSGGGSQIATAPRVADDCGDYPCDIGIWQGIKCGLDPWTTECEQLKEAADIQRGIRSGALTRPPSPPPVGLPTGALTPGTGPTVNQDPTLAVNEIIDTQSEAYRAAVQNWADSQASGQCGAIKGECAAKFFSAFVSPSKDCTECVFDWSKSGSLFLIGGGLLLGGLILVKLLK